MLRFNDADIASVVSVKSDNRWERYFLQNYFILISKTIFQTFQPSLMVQYILP